MAPNNSSFPFSRPTGHDNTTPRTQDWQHCPPFANEFFPPLENTLPSFLSAALNVPLGVATTFANLVVLLAMRRVTSIRLPSKLLLCSLVLTDLGVGSVVQPQFAAFLFHRAIYPDLVPCPLYRSLIFAEFVFSIASLWTLAAISLWPIRRFVLPPEVSTDCDDQARLCSARLHLGIFRVLRRYIPLQGWTLATSNWFLLRQHSTYHFYFLYQDLPPITSSAGSSPSSHSSAATSG